jgi:hypothetical protein
MFLRAPYSSRILIYKPPYPWQQGICRSVLQFFFEILSKRDAGVLSTKPSSPDDTGTTLHGPCLYMPSRTELANRINEAVHCCMDLYTLKHPDYQRIRLSSVQWAKVQP